MWRGATTNVLVAVVMAHGAGCHGNETAASGGVKSTATAAPKPVTREDGMSMKTVEVVDAALGQRAYTMSVPADWAFEGAVLRDLSGPGTAQLVFRSGSRDGLRGAQLLPGYDWELPTPGLPPVRHGAGVSHPPTSAEDLLRRFVIPEARPGAQVVASDPRPELAERLEGQDRQTNQMIAQTARGMPTGHVKSEYSRLRVAYSQGGHPIEEWFVATVSVSVSAPMQTVGRAPVRFSSAHASVTTARAPRGELLASEETFLALFRSVTADPAWTQRQAAIQQQANQQHTAAIVAQGQADQQRIMQQSQQALARNKAIFNSSMRNARMMSDASHRSAMATAQHMGDHQTVVDPTTGRTGQVSNQFNHGFADESGRVVQTNDPTYDPNAQLRGTWTRLQPINPQ